MINIPKLKSEVKLKINLYVMTNQLLREATEVKKKKEKKTRAQL